MNISESEIIQAKQLFERFKSNFGDNWQVALSEIDSNQSTQQIKLSLQKMHNSNQSDVDRAVADTMRRWSR